MNLTRKITDDLYWVGANDRRLALFENIHPLYHGVSYNAYVLLDEKTVLFDTADWAVGRQFIENIRAVLDGRTLDYLVINHVEPDHAASIEEVLLRWPGVRIITTPKAVTLLRQFGFPIDADRVEQVKEGDTRCFGKHTVTFVNAPMVHWPEVMVTFDTTNGVLFSADAFGSFRSLDGKLFADEFDFRGEWISDARRYFTNIVGKYGPQVQALLKKASKLDIARICPLHGPVVDTPDDIAHVVKQYGTWSAYEVETPGICICYSSVYGHTKTAVSQLKEVLLALGCPKVAVSDLARDDMPEAVEDAFRYGTLVLATTTYNMDVFPCMRHFIEALVERNYQKRRVALIENGSWAPCAAKVMKSMLSKCRDITYVSPVVTIHSALEDDTEAHLIALANALVGRR